MTLQAVVGFSLGALKGIASPEVGRAYGRAYDLWKQLGSRPELFAIVGGLWFYYVVAGKLEIARGIGAELLRMAEAANSPAMLVTACSCLGITLHHLGDHRRAHEYFERASGAYDVELRAAFIGLAIEPGVSSLAESARVLWVLGYPDRALARIRDALALADRIGHPESVAFASLFGAFIHQFRGERRLLGLRAPPVQGRGPAPARPPVGRGGVPPRRAWGCAKWRGEVPRAPCRNEPRSPPDEGGETSGGSRVGRTALRVVHRRQR